MLLAIANDLQSLCRRMARHACMCPSRLFVFDPFCISLSIGYMCLSGFACARDLRGVRIFLCLFYFFGRSFSGGTVFFLLGPLLYPRSLRASNTWCFLLFFL
jgi:hypothetical protein